jgi:hypothetical protein
MVKLLEVYLSEYLSQKIDEPRFCIFDKVQNDFKLKSLIMAQIERWRQA